jgi:hypothetical protein
MRIREFSTIMERETSIWCARSRYGFGVEHIVFVEKSSDIFGLGQMQTLRITIDLNAKEVMQGTKILELKNGTKVLNELVKK